MADKEYMGGVRRQNGRLGRATASRWEARLRFHTVQSPIARAHAREKAHLRNMHPDVISQTNKINEGNKRNLAESRTDLVRTLRKNQRDIGRNDAMK